MSTPRDPAQALADLVELSSQIEGAVLVEVDGAVAASTFGDDGRAAAVAGAGRELLRAAGEAAAGAERAALSQLVATLPEGSVFAVREGDLTVTAVTGPEPTVGLVLYDLRTCLRLAGEGGDSKPERAPETTGKGDA